MKMMIFGRRRGGMTLRELHAYMVDVHGAMVVGYIHAQPGLAPRRYVQNHVFDSARRVSGDTPDPFALDRDFVTQVWFDTPAQAGASLETPFYREQLRPDEDSFVDQRSVVQVPVTERDLKPIAGSGAGSGSVKVFLLLKSSVAVTHGDFMAASDRVMETLCATGAIDAVRWVRNQAMQRPGGGDAALDVIHELWLGSESEARIAAARLMDAVASDLPAWIEPGSTCLLLATEQVLFAGGAS